MLNKKKLSNAARMLDHLIFFTVIIPDSEPDVVCLWPVVRTTILELLPNTGTTEL